MASSTQTVISKLKILCVSSPRLYFNYWRINVYSSTCLRDFYGKNFSQKKWINVQTAPINIVSKNLFENFDFFYEKCNFCIKNVIINFSRMKSIHVLMWVSSPWPMWCTLWCMAGEWGHWSTSWLITCGPRVSSLPAESNNGQFCFLSSN